MDIALMSCHVGLFCADDERFDERSGAARISTTEYDASG